MYGQTSWLYLTSLQGLPRWGRHNASGGSWWNMVDVQFKRTWRSGKTLKREVMTARVASPGRDLHQGFNCWSRRHDCRFFCGFVLWFVLCGFCVFVIFILLWNPCITECNLHVFCWQDRFVRRDVWLQERGGSFEEQSAIYTVDTICRRGNSCDYDTAEKIPIRVDLRVQLNTPFGLVRLFWYWNSEWTMLHSQMLVCDLKVDR